MTKYLFDNICKENNLARIDLRNSQFAILSYILRQKASLGQM